MRSTDKMIAVVLLSSLASAACSSSSSPSDGGSGGTSGGSGGASGSAFMALPPCTDMTQYTTTGTTVMTTADFKYSPACLKVAKGTSVTIQASSTHPLSGLSTGSPNNPILTGGKTSDQTVTFPAAGFFPYHCDIHFSIGMTGVIWVQ